MHAIEHYRFVALERHPWNDGKVSMDFMPCGNEISSGQKAGHAHIAAKVFILDCRDMEPCTEALVHSLDLLAQNGSENRSSHDRAEDPLWILQTFTAQPAHQRLELIRKAAHHTDAVFDLRIIAVMFPRGNRPAGPQVNLVAKECERRSQLRAQLILDD